MLGLAMLFAGSAVAFASDSSGWKSDEDADYLDSLTPFQREELKWEQMEEEDRRQLEEKGGIFAEDLLSGESLSQDEQQQYYGFGNQSTTKTIELDHVTRTLDRDKSVAGDVKIVGIVHIIIPEDMTLTIEKGATMTISGALIVEGKLVNNGTIVVGDPKAKNGAATGYLTNYGSIVSAGTVNVAHGEISNEGTGKLENKGTLTISNQSETLTGLSNNTIRKGSGMQYGAIVNTGTINVQNKGGTGIRILKETTLDNQGAIYKAEGATIKGTVGGNKPLAQPK